MAGAVLQHGHRARHGTHFIFEIRVGHHGVQLPMRQLLNALAQTLRGPAHGRPQQQRGTQAGHHAQQQQSESPALNLLGKHGRLFRRALCPGLLAAHQIQHKLVGCFKDAHVFRTDQKPRDFVIFK